MEIVEINKEGIGAELLKRFETQTGLKLDDRDAEILKEEVEELIESREVITQIIPFEKD